MMMPFNRTVPFYERRIAGILFQAVVLCCFAWSSVAGSEETVFRSRGYCAAPAVSPPGVTDTTGTVLPTATIADVPVVLVACVGGGEVKEAVFRTRSFCATSPAVQQAPADTAPEVETTMPLSPLYLFIMSEGPNDYVNSPWTTYSPPALPSLTLVRTISTVSAPSAGAQAIKAGPVLMWPHAYYGHYYDKGVSASLGQPQNTSVQELAGGVLMTFGDHWRLDYTGTETIYGNALFRNSFDHDIKLGWATSIDDWVFSMDQEYRTSTVPLAETGIQTAQEEDITTIKISHYLASNTLNEFEFNQDLLFLEPGTPTIAPLTQNVREWSGTDWINYEFFHGFSGAIGPTLGFDSLDPVGTDMSFERLQGRFFWLVSQKLLLQVRGGVEDRQYINSPGNDLFLPIGEGTITYKPVDETTPLFTVGRSVRPSYFINQVSENTYYSFSGQQRLFKKVYFNVDAAYQTTDYTSGQGDTSGLGTDRQYVFGFRLSTTFLEGGTVSALYRFGYLSSTRAGAFEYGTSRVGFEVGYRF